MAYLIAITLTWAVFALLYRTLLARETFFTMNRIYLLLALGAGLVFPWLSTQGTGLAHLSETGSFAAMLPEITVNVTRIATSSGPALGWVQWLVVAGMIPGAVRLIYGLWRLYSIYQGSRRSRSGVRFTRDASMPFSFFRAVFVPENFQNNTQLDAMIRHEQAHAQGWHSLDVLFAEMICIVFWWNPLAYWYKSALRTVHEYIADAAAAQLHSRKQYGLLLIQQAQSGPVHAFANHFLQSPLKQRLVMLTKKHSAPIQGLRYTLAMPLAFFMLMLFQQTQVQAQSKPEKTVKSADDPDQLPEYPGGQQEMMQYLANNIKYPKKARKEKAQGTAYISFLVDTNGDVKDPKSLKPIHKDLEKEAIRVVKAMHFKPAMKNGAPVKCTFTLPIKFKLE